MRLEGAYQSSSKVSDTKWASAPKPYNPCPFRTLLTSAEAYYIFTKNLGPGNYAHLGVYKGGSVWCQLHGLKGTDAKVYAVDLWEIMPDTAAEDTHKDFMKTTCDAAGFSNTLVICKGSTSSWAERLSNLQFRFIFIDASHDYDNAHLDWVMWSPLVAEGGEVAFHDVDIHSVVRVIDEIDKKEWEEVEGCYSIRTFKRK
jgi:predicted O-methyltransferase YrrM